MGANTRYTKRRGRRGPKILGAVGVLGTRRDGVIEALKSWGLWGSPGSKICPRDGVVEALKSWGLWGSKTGLERRSSA